MSQPGWVDFLECRNFCQTHHKGQALSMNTTDQQRFAGACLYAGNGEVVAELNLRIRRGRQAGEQLKTPVKDRSEPSYV